MDQNTPPVVPKDFCWMPTMALEPGMVLARPVLSGTGANPAMRLAAGSELTASTIAQLVNKGIECAAVVRTPSDSEPHAESVREYEARLREIFGPAPDADCLPLYAALLADGPDPC